MTKPSFFFVFWRPPFDTTTFQAHLKWGTVDLLKTWTKTVKVTKKCLFYFFFLRLLLSAMCVCTHVSSINCAGKTVNSEQTERDIGHKGRLKTDTAVGRWHNTHTCGGHLGGKDSTAFKGPLIDGSWTTKVSMARKRPLVAPKQDCFCDKMRQKVH